MLTAVSVDVGRSSKSGGVSCIRDLVQEIAAVNLGVCRLGTQDYHGRRGSFEHVITVQTVRSHDTFFVLVPH